MNSKKTLGYAINFLMACCALCLVLCACMAVATRMSFTDYAENEQETLRLPYRFGVASVEDLNGLAGAEGAVAASDLVRESPVILLGKVREEMSIGYRMIARSVEVLRVIKGDVFDEGDVIAVGEQVEIGRMNGADAWRLNDAEGYEAFEAFAGVSDGEVPVVWEPVERPFMQGATPACAGDTYVYFLENQPFYEIEGVRYTIPVYMPMDNPLARLNVDDREAIVLDPARDFMSADEASRCALIVADVAAARRYQDVRGRLLDEIGIH